VLGLLVWALIAGSTYINHAFGWVMFVSVTLWVITTCLFVVYFLGVPEKTQFVPWPIAMMIFNVNATVLYITAFITNAASVPINGAADYNNLAAAAFFACLVMIAYSASSFFSFMAFRGQGSNAATNQATGNLPA
ncbi:PLLP protein, partial [Polyodon spathula]|nr:PLLP protein [Polyodon spathula]